MSTKMAHEMSKGQRDELLGPLINEFLSTEATAAQYWIGRKRLFVKQLRELFRGTPVADPFAEVLADWQEFWGSIGFQLDLSGLYVPRPRPGLNRLINMAEGAMPQRLYDKSANLFPCWKYTDTSLDEAVPYHHRNPANGAYAIWIRGGREPEKDFKKLSANDLTLQCHNGNTLPERQTFGLKYFKETGQHPDVANWTLCTGSRLAGGVVPGVYCGSGGTVLVHCFGPDRAGDGLRSREVVF